MEENDIFAGEEEKSGGWSLDKIIEKFIPIIGAVLLTTGIAYLLYTNVWNQLGEGVRLALGFLTSFGIIFGATKISNKFRYLADVVIGIGILLMYGTLIYGASNDDVSKIMIPEVATLIVSFVFTAFIALFASMRKSKVILILGMIGAYVTPFVIGQNDVWTQTISFNAYLIYFAAINITVFQLGKELSIRNIIPLNMAGLFFGTSTLYSLSYTAGIESVANSDMLSAVLFLFLAVFSMWSIIITSKKFEEEDEGYIALGYIATVGWFIFNMGILVDISDLMKSLFYLVLSGSSFYGWYFLKDTKTRYQHTSLYALGIGTLILAFFNIIPDLNTYSSLAIAYSSLVFGWLYTQDSSKNERLFSYGLLSIIGAFLSIANIYDGNGVEHFKTAYVVGALIPAMMAYFIVKKSKNEDYIEFGQIYSVFAAGIAGTVVFIDFIKLIDISFVLYYIPTLVALIYLLTKGKDSKNKSVILRFSLGWFILGYFGLFFSLLGDLYPSPLNTHFFTNGGVFADWTIIKGIIASIIFFLGLKISRSLEDEKMEKRPSFILVILLYSSLLVIVNYIIFAIMNDLGSTQKVGGIRAIIASIWWIILSIHMLLIGVRKGKRFHSEKFLGLLLLFLTVVKIVFYDMETTSTENKIIVLIITGGILMLFSYFVQKKGWLKSDETEEKPKVNVNEIINKIELPGVIKVKFDLYEGKDFTTKSLRIMQIMSFVTKKYGKNKFEAGELENMYNYILENYESELDKKTYNMVTKKLKDFVEVGGKIIFE